MSLLPVILNNLPFSFQTLFGADTPSTFFSFAFPTSQPTAVKNTSTSYPFSTLLCYLSPCPKQALWVLTFQPQSFQSCSLAVIFISAALQQHRHALSSVWSHLPSFPTSPTTFLQPLLYRTLLVFPHGITSSHIPFFQSSYLHANQVVVTIFHHILRPHEDCVLYY